MTNREWLESLSDEELANNIYCLINGPDLLICCPKYDECNDCKLAWLQAEHKDV